MPASSPRHRHALAPAATSAQTWAAALAAILLTLSVEWRALGGFFNSDDLIHLEQAAGLVPTLPTPWRLLSQVAYFRAMLAAFGPNPVAFLVVNLVAHLACVAGVVVIARRLGASAAGAALAGTLFGACPLFLPLLMHAVAVNEWMSGAAWIATFLLATRKSRPRVGVATAVFALGLLAKESIVALPVVLLVARPQGEPLRLAARRLRPLLVASALAVTSFVATRALGLAPAGTPYEVAVGPNVLVQLATYTRWAFAWSDPLPDLIRFPDPLNLVPGLALILALAAFGFGSSAAARRVRIGLAWWIAGLAPVLVLERSTYGHYAYVPLGGLALAVAGVGERIAVAVAGLARLGAARPETQATLEHGAEPASAHTATNAGPRSAAPRWARRLAGAGLAFAAVVYAMNADALMLRRLAATTADGAWPRDATLRSMEAIRRAVVSLTTTLRPEDRRVAIFGLTTLRNIYGARTGQTYGSERKATYDLLRASLDEGRALRLFAPQLESVAFVDDSLPADPSVTLYVRRAGEWLDRMGRGPEATPRLARWMDEESRGR